MENNQKKFFREIDESTFGGSLEDLDYVDFAKKFTSFLRICH